MSDFSSSASRAFFTMCGLKTNITLQVLGSRPYSHGVAMHLLAVVLHLGHGFGMAGQHHLGVPPTELAATR